VIVFISSFDGRIKTIWFLKKDRFGRQSKRSFFVS